MNDTPEKGGTSPLNFGGSNPFTSGQTEPLTDALPEDMVPATDHDPVTETVEAPGTPAEEVPTQTASEETTSATEAPAGEVSASDEQPAEQVGEVTAPSIEQEESTPVVPADASTTPAEELAPTAEAPATLQTELETEVAKELNALAGNPAEPVTPISSATDAEIDADIKARDALNAKIEDGQKAQRSEVIGMIKKTVETYKIPLPELAEALGIKGTRKGSKAKPKYRNPADGKKWSGRGKEPLWIKGKDRNDFLITA